MTTAEFIQACKDCCTAEKAAELLRNACMLAVKYDEQAETIRQYSEQVARLTERVEDLTSELEEKRIELAELGSLSALIGRLGAVTVRSEAATDKLGAVVERIEQVDNLAPEQQDKPAPKSKKQVSKKVDSKKKVDEDDPPGFAEFWEVYPKKVKRKLSAEKWAKIAPDDELKERIIAAVKAWSKTDEWTKDNGAFVPHPTVWLNGQRWNDELPKSAVKAEKSDSGGHSYDLDKLINHAKNQFNGSDKNESKKSEG